MGGRGRECELGLVGAQLGEEVVVGTQLRSALARHLQRLGQRQPQRSHQVRHQLCVCGASCAVCAVCQFRRARRVRRRQPTYDCGRARDAGLAVDQHPAAGVASLVDELVAAVQVAQHVLPHVVHRLQHQILEVLCRATHAHAPPHTHTRHDTTRTRHVSRETAEPSLGGWRVPRGSRRCGSSWRR